MHNGDGEVREREARIQGLDAIILPILDLLEIDVCHDFRGELELPSLNALQIVDNRYGARDGRNMEDRTCFRLRLLLFVHDPV